MRSTVTLLALTSLVSAHFNLNYPPARGFDEDLLGNFPCGSQDTVSSNRTLWPLSGGEIALTMGHITANIAVLIGLGNSPGSAFNTIILNTFTEQGLGSFCFDVSSLPSSLNITDGTNATLQVMTNGDPDGGLYNCADITFSSTAPGPASGVCANGTGVTTLAATVKGLPNATTTSTSNSSATSSGGAAATSKSAAVAERLGLGMGGLVVAGMGALAMVL